MRRALDAAARDGASYAVDPALVDRRVELRFDPEDLTRLDVYWEGRRVGQAVPFVVRRHVHRQVPPAEPPAPAPAGARSKRKKRR
jgi:putative transposase